MLFRSPLCRTDTPIVYLHHNFYCWNGHHFTPNQPHQLDEADPEHQLVYDWNHIETLETVPDDHYFKTHLNRIMLDEIHAVTLKYFDIDVWDEIPSSKATLARLTPEVIERVHKTRPDVTERDMRVNAVYCVARAKAGTQINH